MSQPRPTWQTLDQETLVRLVIDLFHRTLVHYGLWFREVDHQMGQAAATRLEDDVFRSSFATQMQRLAKLLGFEVDEAGVPLRLKQMNREELLELARAQAVNWLASDGIWFQAVEKETNLESAKRINDTCWVRFSPYEARRIRILLGLGKDCGLEGLKTALTFRAYGLVNRQSVHDTDDGGFVFQMNDCRVQAARKRRGLPDYPCRSVGVVEYPSFARTIDPRIVTECLGCPPDSHPEEWYCAWKFRLAETAADID